MFCDRCGTQMQDRPGYCPTCGKAVGAIPLMPVESRLSGHIRLLGILWLAFSAIRFLPGLVVLMLFQGQRFTPLPPEVPFFVNTIIHFAAYALILFGAAGLLAGWGLLERQPWARTLTMVLGGVTLIDVPFGTALGVYTLWVLMPARSEEEYRRIARAA